MIGLLSSFYTIWRKEHSLSIPSACYTCIVVCTCTHVRMCMHDFVHTCSFIAHVHVHVHLYVCVQCMYTHTMSYKCTLFVYTLHVVCIYLVVGGSVVSSEVSVLS